MLIRTQGKSKIINSDKTSVIETYELQGTHKWMIRAIVSCGPEPLGMYGTRERALEILDDICEADSIVSDESFYAMPER